MSYLALARKWRPRRFEDVMGQGHVIQALAHALGGDKLHPAILLTGTRGVGKTTLARIVAKGLNCETGVTATPCGQCSACREVDEGRSVDMLEIDAASNTGVDNIREIIENSQYAPARSRYKVYLIDEVHMLSKGAFNALLKTLEEPPPHVKFILATTDPQKLPVTVLSRCLQFNLKRMTVSLIRDQLALVLKQEGLEFELPALAEIARAADGSMRDGLSLLDQAIAYSGGAALQRAAVEDMLGTRGRETLFEIIAALAQGSPDALLAAIQKLEAQAPDYAALLNDLAAHLQRISVLQLLPGARSEEDEAALIALKDQLRPEDVQLYYQIAVLGRRDLPWAPDPRLGFEMTLLRMLAFRPDEGAPSRPVSAGTRAASATPAAVAAAPAPTVAAAPELDWAQRIDQLGLDVFTKALARSCEWVSRAPGEVRLMLDGKAKHLLQDERRSTLEQALSRHFGEAVRLVVDVAPVPVDTPALRTQQRMEQAQRDAERAIEADPSVRAMKDLFGASVRPGSVRPVDAPSDKTVH